MKLYYSTILALVLGLTGCADIALYHDRADPCQGCLLYTSPSPRDRTRSRMPSSA